MEKVECAYCVYIVGMHHCFSRHYVEGFCCSDVGGVFGFDGGDEAADADAVDEEVYGVVFDVGEEGVEGVLGCYVDGVGLYL